MRVSCILMISRLSILIKPDLRGSHMFVDGLGRSLKLKVIDALTRRAGIGVQEKHSHYISQRCPRCGNIAALPTLRRCP